MRQALEAWCAGLLGHGAIWLVQSTALLAFGLVVGRLVRRAGPAVQNGVYRATLVGVVVCPAASALLAVAGVDGPELPMPSAPREIRAIAVPESARPGVAGHGASGVRRRTYGGASLQPPAGANRGDPS